MKILIVLNLYICLLLCFNTTLNSDHMIINDAVQCMGNLIILHNSFVMCM